MASSQPSSYFPPLDKCLAGDERLISWKTAYRALCDTDAAIANSILEIFLTDSESVNLLSRALNPFAKPSVKTKADFETKTAPIHVSQSTNGDYDLEELKKDALWLSQNLDVEEVTALRVVVLEWQQRAEDQLRILAYGNDSAFAVATSNGLGTSQIGNSVSSFTQSSVAPPKIAVDFNNEDTRRDRQLEVYLEEKNYILKISNHLISQDAVLDRVVGTSRGWIDRLGDKVVEDQCSTGDAALHNPFCTSCIEDVARLIQELGDGTKWPLVFTANEVRRFLYERAMLAEMATVLRLILASFYALKPGTVVGANIVSSWFQIMAETHFFTILSPSPALPDASALQCLASVISVHILDVKETLAQFERTYLPDFEGVYYPQVSPEPYFKNDACIREINIVLCRAAQEEVPLAAPSIFAWSILTSFIREYANAERNIRERQREEDSLSDGESTSRRRASRRESVGELSALEKKFALLQDFELEGEARDDPPKFLAVAAEYMNVFANISQLATIAFSLDGAGANDTTSFMARNSLLTLVDAGARVAYYSDDLLEAIIAILSPAVHGRPTEYDTYLADYFLADREGLQNVLDQALTRYPYELSPMLRLLTVLSSASCKGYVGPSGVALTLDNLEKLTIMVPDQFRAYELSHEDENLNAMALTASLPLFVSRQALSVYGPQYIGRPALTMGSGEDHMTNVLAVPSGAPGYIVKESRPLVFSLQHAHSGLEYLGLLLSTTLPKSELLVAPFDQSGQDCTTAAEIVILINSLLSLCLRQQDGADEAKFVLGRLAFALHDEQDIITVISDLFEVELQAHLEQTVEDGSLELLVACANFFDILIDISPERVWADLMNSNLLGINGGANSLAAVVGGSEVPSGRYRFLATCVKMYSHLLLDTVAGLVKRKSKVGKGANRFNSGASVQDATPERTMSVVLAAYQTVMIDAWQSLSEWKFLSQSEQSEIAMLILGAFESLLTKTYGVGTDQNKIFGLLQPSATALLAAFSSNVAMLQSFATILSISMQHAGSEFITGYETHTLVSMTNAAFSFLACLSRSIRMGENGSKRAYDLATQLIKLIPFSTPLWAVDQSFKGGIANLLTEIVGNLRSGSNGVDPPSLLGRLNPETAKSFHSVTSQLDRPLQDIEVERRIWNFLSAIMGGKQQWFALFLLTGTIPKDRLRDKSTNGTAAKSKSLLAYALDQLSAIATVPPERAMSMLKFVAMAQETWIWATNAVRSHSEFLKNALDWLNSLQLPSRPPNVAEEMILASENQMAAYLCDILAVNLHSSLEVGDKTLLKMLTSKLEFLRQHGVAVNAYNRSLHRNLTENFSRKFPSCSVADFTRTAANPAPLGRAFFYDVDLATTVLGHEAAWQGMVNGKSQGFAEEFARANVNISLVEAQKGLLKSWRVLATTLCECAGQDPALQGELAVTAESCLRANAETNLEQSGMDEVVKMRAEMAFVLISKLVSIRAPEPAMKNLLPAAWDLVRASPIDYDVATAPEDLTYYRTLLQVLYLSIQPYAYLDAPPPARATDETRVDFLDPTVAACLVEITAKVIAPGFRALCGNLHSAILLAEPGDFALLTALLRALLSVRGVAAVHQQLADVVANASIVRGALSLYSWSDQLAEVMDQDPIYGEVAIMFLLALSTIRPVAEQIALNGALAQLSSANLSTYYRKAGGKGPFAEPRRIFAIWAEGLLPLCLNLLDAVGPPIAADVAAFLNSFPEQLKRAETALELREASRQHPHAGEITLGLVSEAHSLCFIGMILASDTARGAAEGINAADVPQLQYDYKKVRDDAAGLMRQRTSLASRVVAIGEREEEWRISGAGIGGMDNKLLSMVVREVNGLVKSLGGGSE